MVDNGEGKSICTGNVEQAESQDTGVMPVSDKPRRGGNGNPDDYNNHQDKSSSRRQMKTEGKEEDIDRQNPYQPYKAGQEYDIEEASSIGDNFKTICKVVE